MTYMLRIPKILVRYAITTLKDVCQTGMCGLYGWVFFRSKIYRNGHVLQSVDMGFTEFIRKRHKSQAEALSSFNLIDNL